MSSLLVLPKYANSYVSYVKPLKRVSRIEDAVKKNCHLTNASDSFKP